MQRSRRVTASVLDRLLDDAPQEASDPPRNLQQQFESFKASVKRDLELLLNTRREAQHDLSAYEEAAQSLLSYGLPDFTSLSLRSEIDRGRMQQEIESAIATFEPRLVDVRVSVREPDQMLQRLAFRVDALLRVDPAPAPVTFDATVELSTQRYQLRG